MLILELLEFDDVVDELGREHINVHQILKNGTELNN
jgi:hypothetical protein